MLPSRTWCLLGADYCPVRFICFVLLQARVLRSAGLVIFGEAYLRDLLNDYALYTTKSDAISWCNDPPDFRRMQEVGRTSVTPIPGWLRPQYVRV